MADEISGGYYHELNRKGEVVKAHNAKGEEVGLLSDEQIAALVESGEPAPLKGPESPEQAARAAQAAAVPAKSTKKGAKR